MGLFSKLFKSKEEKELAKRKELGLKTNRTYSFSNLKKLIESKNTVDESFLKELEECLILSDMGLDYTALFMDELRKKIKKNKITSVESLKELLIEEFQLLYKGNESKDLKTDNPLTVYLFIGVNGSGKTTSIAKLAYKLKLDGKKVLIGAGDTFRAAATEQLIEWGKRIGVDIMTGKLEQDPASVIFDSLKKAKDEHYDYLLLDTAGRLQTKVNLMKELEKIYRVIGREVNNAPHETFLVIDSTTGQNGVNQAKVFNEAAKITGIILTKLDGSSKGGIALSISNTLGVPVKLYGSGEKETDIEVFDLNEYLFSIFNGILIDEE